MADKVKMLIADDSQANRMILYDEFKLEYEVISAVNGRETLDMLEKNPDTAIVILDLIMPEMDGFKVLKKMSSSEKLCTIPVIAITSSDRNEDLVTALDMGAFDVMTKPLNLSILQHKIWNMLARTASFREEKSSAIIRQMAENSEIDEKTGIFNKRAFCRKTKEMLDRNPSERYLIVRIDIDGFKVLNDVYGVSECDHLLKMIGDTISQIGSDKERVFGRWEADHFVICMTVDDFHRYHVAERFRDPLDGYFDFVVSIRMGIYVIDEPSLDIALMCDRALLALRSAKGNYSKHLAFYDDTMRLELIEKQQILNEMKAALESGQFVVYYQPQYNYATQTLHGAEALVRWIHPEKGLIPPIKFIPVFEQNGFITHLDQFVWEEVCRYQRKWLDEGRKIVPISVNVSRIDICSLRLAEYFRKLVEKYDLPTSAIRIEITESAYIDNPSQLIGAVQKLREAGFNVEMDDFGSGYSSLNSLKDVPVDLLKLDMKFIEKENGVEESRGGSILSSVVRMSNWLRLPVLAEGVETKNQAEYLKSIGCVYMQGYYFAKPMPAKDYEEILNNNGHEIDIQDSFTDDISNAMEFLNASTQSTLLFNSFVGGAAIIEYDGHVVDAVRINDRFFEIVNSSREDYMKKCTHLLDDFDKLNQEKFIKCLKRAITTHTEASCELCSEKIHDGVETWTRAQVRLLATNCDKYLFYLTIENISQRMNLLVSNLRLTDQLTTIINNVPGGIADYEMQESGGCKLLYFNDKLPLMFGYTREEYDTEFKDRPLQAIYPEDIDEVIKQSRMLFDGVTNSIMVRFRHLCKDGTWKWVEFNAGRTRRQASLLYVTATITDLDGKIRAEQKAATKERESARRQKLMDAILSNIPYGIVQMTYNLNRYEFSECNDNAWKILGCKDKDDFRKKFTLADFKLDILDENLDLMYEAVRRVIDAQDGYQEIMDFSVKVYDGRTVKLHNIIQKIICNNEIEYIQHMFIPTE